MNYPNISMYARIHDVTSAEIIPIDIFLEHIRNGEWQDIVIPIRAMKDKKARDERKKAIAPSVTLSGSFSARFDDKIIQHSGFIGVDVDDLGANTEAFKALVMQDKYTYNAFTSISGYGVCVVVRIDPDRHKDAYMGLAAYYLQKYKVVVDPTGINPSRARFVSFDPNMGAANESSEVFKKYLPKERKQKPPPVVFVQSEFDDVVRQMVERRVNCCEEYRDWLKVCFALCNRFGEAGSQYFHQLSAISAKYSPEVVDKQYAISLKHEELWSGNRATLATIYFHAKQAGINISSEKTKKVSAATTSMKKSGLNKEQIIANLEKFEGIPRAECEHIVAQAFDSGADFHEDSDNLIDNVILWLKSNYSLRKNEITLRVENANKPVSDEDFNTIFLMAKKIFSDLTYDLFCRCVYSNFTPSYNPFTEWWEYNQDTTYNEEITKFWSCIEIADGEWDKLVYFGTKWLVALVASIYGNKSPLMLTFTGPIGIGKTRIFRDLLPLSWRSPNDYYTESATLGQSKDDDILMTQKILIVDDEFGGMGKKEQRKFKAISDKDTFSIRVPYGRHSTDLRRLCMLGATCNEAPVLSDPVGNRRILPFEVISVDWEAINMINRDALWAEVFRMYHSGEDYTVVKKDIERLAAGNEKFIDFSLEYELINKYFELPDSPTSFGVQEMTASQIKEHIDRMSNQKTNLNRIGQELQNIGFEQIIKKVNKRTCRVYQVIEKSIGFGGLPPFQTGNPF